MKFPPPKKEVGGRRTCANSVAVWYENSKLNIFGVYVNI